MGEEGQNQMHGWRSDHYVKKSCQFEVVRLGPNCYQPTLCLPSLGVCVCVSASLARRLTEARAVKLLLSVGRFG